MKKHLPLMFLLICTTVSHSSDVAIFEDQPAPKTAKEAHLQAGSFLTTLKHLKSAFDTELKTFLSQNKDRQDEVHKIEFIETRLDGLGNSISCILILTFVAVSFGYERGKGESVGSLRLRACAADKIPFPISSKGRTVS